MPKRITRTLREILLNIDKEPWDHALYIPNRNINWLPDMPAIILDPNVTDESEDDPIEAKKNQLKYALTIGEVQDVIDNVKVQKENPDIKNLIKALCYYYENDTFIDLAKTL
ncbi:MAG: hypothetical protein KTR19_11410 [Hyphomicrobiales bacterium]|nr:hypothetical protein [Hyphomicrobiales bacterium]